MYSIIVMPAAEREMFEAATYIAEKLCNPIAAGRLLDAAYTAIESLGDMPKRRPLVDDIFLASQGLRLFLVRNYLLFYIVDDETNTVHILRFLYGGRNWMSILRLDPSENDG